MKIAVIGAGHMGSWMIDMLKFRHQVSVFDVDPARTEKLDQVQVLQDLKDMAGIHPELLINAVSLQNTVQVFELVLPFLDPDSCILSDLASVKGHIPEFYKNSPFRFVSIHPMFGPTFANVVSMAKENVIIIRESDKKTAGFFRDLFGSLGLNLHEYSFEEHDRMIAYSLTLPFASTMVFAACMDNTAVPGTTFKKHREIAKGLLSENDFLLSEILFNPHSLYQLEKVTGRLDFLKHVIRDRDFEEAQKFFSRLRTNIK